MLIRTKINLSAIATGVVLAVFIGSIFFLSNTLDHAYQKQQVVQKITEAAFQAILLQSDYLIYPSERARAQWVSVYQVQSRLLDEAAPLFVSKEEKLLFDEIQTISASAGTLFEELVRNAETGSNDVNVQELNNQLAVKAQARVSGALRLAELSREEATAAQRTFNVIVIILGLLVAGIYTLSYFITNSVVASLRVLEKDFTRISALDFSTTTTTTTTGEKGEIGMLQQAFSVMVSKLKESYTTLEQKVRSRTQDLEDARIAARNVLEDLGVEKERLVEINAKEEAIFASIADGCIVVNEEGQIILINQAAQKMLGFSSEESMGKQWHEILHREDENGNPISPENGAIRAALTTTTTNVISFYYVRKDGTKFPVVRTVSPIILREKIIGVVNIFRDVTREKEIEKLRTDFLSLASHQLRTPLSGTKWLIETLQRGILGKMTAEQKSYLNDIYELNERMIKLVFDMLNVLRSENDTIPIKKEIISLTRLYDDLILMVNPAAKEKGWMVLRNLLKNKKDVTIETDAQILRIILECFVYNAIQYSEQGREIMLDVTEDANDSICSVKDYGIGIPKEEQKRISERFFRASNAKLFKPGGTGLGVYIAFMLAKKIGAKISFESEEGKGSTFYLRIPKVVADSL